MIIPPESSTINLNFSLFCTYVKMWAYIFKYLHVTPFWFIVFFQQGGKNIMHFNIAHADTQGYMETQTSPYALREWMLKLPLFDYQSIKDLLDLTDYRWSSHFFANISSLTLKKPTNHSVFPASRCFYCHISPQISLLFSLCLSHHFPRAPTFSPGFTFCYWLLIIMTVLLLITPLGVVAALGAEMLRPSCLY